MSGRNREPSTRLPSGSVSDRSSIFSSPEVGNIFYNTDTSNVEIRHEDPSNNAAWRDLVVNNKEQIDLSGEVIVKNSLRLPRGTTTERDAHSNIGNIFFNTDTSNVEIYHQDPSNNAAWRDLVVNNKGSIELSGNIGIGATNPDAPLRIAKNFTFKNIQNTSVAITANSTSSGVVIGSLNGNLPFITDFNGSGVNSLGLSIRQGNAERMRFKNNGEIVMYGNFDVNGNTKSKCFFSDKATVDSGIDNRLSRFGGTSKTHFDVNYRLQRDTTPTTYRTFEIGLLGDNVNNTNVFAIGGYGGGGHEPNIVFGLNADGDGEFARDLYAGRDLDVSGSIQMSNAPIAVAGRTAGRVFGGTFVPNSVLINRPSGFLNTSTGRFQAPSGYPGFYLFTYTGLGGQGERSPNTRWYKNGNKQEWGAAHVNSGGYTPSRWGLSCQVIFDLAEGDFVELRVVTGSLYGSNAAHGTIIALYLFSK